METSEPFSLLAGMPFLTSQGELIAIPAAIAESFRPGDRIVSVGRDRVVDALCRLPWCGGGQRGARADACASARAAGPFGYRSLTATGGCWTSLTGSWP